MSLFGAAAGGALAIGNEILCARFLGANTYGLYAIAVILARISEAFASFGLPVAAIHFISRQREQGEHARVLGSILGSLAPPVVVGATFAITLHLSAPAIARHAFDDPSVAPWIAAIGLAIPFMAVSEVGAVITRAFGHAGYYVLVRNLLPPLVFMALLAIIASSGAPPTWVPGAFTIAYAAAALAACAAVARVAGAPLLRERPAWGLRPLYAYALPVLANTLLYLVVASTALLVLGHFRDPAEVGIFRACMQLVIPFDMVVLAFNAAVAHLYPVLSSGERAADLSAVVRKITGWMTMLALLGLLLVWFNRHDLMGLMGPEFVAGGDTLFMLAVGQAMLCAIGSAGYLLVMSGRQHYETLHAAIAAVACVALSLVLVPAHGGYGGAVATTLALLLISVLRVTTLRRVTGILVVTPAFVRTVLVAVLTAGAAVAAFHTGPLAQGGGLGALLVRSLLLAGLFGALYWWIVIRGAGVGTTTGVGR